MDANLPEYELFAIRYAERDALRSSHFIGGDPHDGPMPMDYFVWAAIGTERSFVIDTGFTAEVAAGARPAPPALPSRVIVADRPRLQQSRRRDHHPSALRPCRYL